MPDTQQRRGPIHSSLESDPSLWEIIHLFVVDMPNRVARMERQFELENWEALIRTAHQLKGASASYGFEGLSEPAWRLERLLREQAPRDVVEAALAELIADCRRVTVGPKPEESV